MMFRLVLCSTFFLFSCKERVSEKTIALTSTDTIFFSALPKKIISPVFNSITEEKIALGKALFFDPILSGNKDVACATCHHPSTGYSEILDISIGVNGVGFGSKRKFKTPNDIPFVKRNAHTILNTAFNGLENEKLYKPKNAPMFWDKRANSLEEQALIPIKAFEEMRGHSYSEQEILPEIIRRLNNIPEYVVLFREAFGGENTVNTENLGRAIAVFERTLVTNYSRFDKYMRGDEDAIHLSEKEGFSLFKKVGCANCHNGPMFSDYKVHTLGVPGNSKLKDIDTGTEDSFGFRTPTLRNLRFTAPYMHNGAFVNLQKVLEFYEDIANDKVTNNNVSLESRDPLVEQLDLSVKEMSLIISFLNTLNDENYPKDIPESVPSGLAVGGNIK